MKKEILKIYKKLAKHKNYNIAHEASLQLKFESGNNSEESKKRTRIESMCDLVSLMVLESQKDNPNLESLTENSFIQAFNRLK